MYVFNVFLYNYEVLYVKHAHGQTDGQDQASSMVVYSTQYSTLDIMKPKTIFNLHIIFLLANRLSIYNQI